MEYIFMQKCCCHFLSVTNFCLHLSISLPEQGDNGKFYCHPFLPWIGQVLPRNKLRSTKWFVISLIALPITVNGLIFFARDEFQFEQTNKHVIVFCWTRYQKTNMYTSRSKGFNFPMLECICYLFSYQKWKILAIRNHNSFSTSFLFR